MDTVAIASGETEEKVVTADVEVDTSQPPIRVVGGATETQRRKIRKILGR